MIHIRPLRAADVPDKVRSQMAAFASHPRMPMMWPRGMTADFWAYHEASDLKDLQDPNARLFKAVDSATGQIVGAADWTLALDAELEAKKATMSTQQPPPEGWPLEGNWAMRRWYKINLQRLIKQYLPNQPYISKLMLQSAGLRSDLFSPRLSDRQPRASRTRHW